MLLGRFLFVYITNINYLLNSVVSFFTNHSHIRIIINCYFHLHVYKWSQIKCPNSVGESMMGGIGGEVWGGLMVVVTLARVLGSGWNCNDRLLFAVRACTQVEWCSSKTWWVGLPLLWVSPYCFPAIFCYCVCVRPITVCWLWLILFGVG